MDSYSEEYHNVLVKQLKFDTGLYTHVDPKLLHEFKALLCKHPTAFWLTGNPLTEVKGFKHDINTGNSLSFLFRSSLRKISAELRALKTD